MKKYRSEKKVRPGNAQLYWILGKQWFWWDIPGVARIVGRYAITFLTNLTTTRYTIF